MNNYIPSNEDLTKVYWDEVKAIIKQHNCTVSTARKMIRTIRRKNMSKMEKEQLIQMRKM